MKKKNKNKMQNSQNHFNQFNVIVSIADIVVDNILISSADIDNFRAFRLTLIIFIGASDAPDCDIV